MAAQGGQATGSGVEDDQSGFIEGEPSDWDFLPPPEAFFTVGIDGGYVRNWVDKKHNFEVIVGKSILSFAEVEGRGALAQALGLSKRWVQIQATSV